MYGVDVFGVWCLVFGVGVVCGVVSNVVYVVVCWSGVYCWIVVVCVLEWGVLLYSCGVWC